MPKKRSLNGLPHNITKSFFGTNRYYGNAYMADWLLNAARKLQLSNASLNILTGNFAPLELNIMPLAYHAKLLKEIIDKELKANEFEPDFIVKAQIDFQFLSPNIFKKGIYCFPFLIDKEGRRYESGRIIAESFEPEFDAFNSSELMVNEPKPKSLLDKFKSLFNN